MVAHFVHPVIQGVTVRCVNGRKHKGICPIYVLIFVHGNLQAAVIDTLQGRILYVVAHVKTTGTLPFGDQSDISVRCGAEAERSVFGNVLTISILFGSAVAVEFFSLKPPQEHIRPRRLDVLKRFTVFWRLCIDSAAGIFFSLTVHVLAVGIYHVSIAAAAGRLYVITGDILVFGYLLTI